MSLLFFDLSLLPSPTSTTSNSRLPAAARALDLGYAAIALDHPDRCRLAPFQPLSSLPLPSSASFHRTRNGSPASEPFRQYTRITLSLDSAAAAASALAPSAARLLRTYDVVAARPLSQATLDHLCQATTDIDLISIDFSHKLPFRLKLPMLKLALQRGLHFEIAYSPLIDDVNSRRQVLAEAKLLVDLTKGKNLIISSAAHNANEIRGPYDVINLCEYLLGLSTQRAKAAMSVNCRSLISKALRKKHFYKETIRIDRLLPNEQLNSTRYKLGDWIGCDPVSFNGDLHFLKTNLEPSSKNDELPSSPINSPTKVLPEKPCEADLSLCAEKLEQSTDDKEVPDETQEGTMQVNRGEVPISCRMSTLLASSADQVIDSYSTLDKPGNIEIVMADNVQAGAASFVDQKCICEHVEFVQDAMEIDVTESCTLNLVAVESAPLSSDVKLACSSLPKSTELSDTSLADKCTDQTTGILDNAKAYAKYDTGCISCEREDQAPVDHGISSGSDACLKDKDLHKPDDIPVDSEVHIDTDESLRCSPGFRDNEAPLNLAVKLSSDLCNGILLQQEVMEDRAEQNMDENIEHTMRGKVEPIDRKARRMISEAQTLHGQDTNSTVFGYDKGSSDTTRENNELKEPNSKETNASLEKDVTKIHEPLNYSHASAKVGISTSRSGCKETITTVGSIRSKHFGAYQRQATSTQYATPERATVGIHQNLYGCNIIGELNPVIG